MAKRCAYVRTFMCMKKKKRSETTEDRKNPETKSINVIIPSKRARESCVD